MRIYEHEAKRVFAREGIPVPRALGVLRDPEAEIPWDGRDPAEIMVKAQVLVGGRGKAGGVAKVGDLEAAREAVRRILGMEIKGYPVEAVLLEEALPHRGACYVGLTVNPATSNVVFMASAEGGVDIEQVAAERPDAILRLELEDNPDQLSEEQAGRVADFLLAGLGEAGRPELRAPLAEVASKLYALYQSADCKVLEINPLLVTETGVVAADAKMVLDDNALFRQGELLRFLGITGKRHDVSEPTARERRAQAAGFPYVDLLPEDAEREPGKVYVGLVPGGAGYGIFSIDEVYNVGERYFDGRAVPLNFMDSGGGPSQKKVEEMFSLLMDHPLCDLIVTSRFGGISSCDVFIRGLVACLRNRRERGERIVPVYGRMVGTDLPAARAFLERARAETPEALEPLSMVVGNQKIMAEVIRDALADFLAKQEG